MQNIRTTRPPEKLDYKRLGPYCVSAVIDDRAYRLQLPRSMHVHNDSHLELSPADRYVHTPPIEGQCPPEPQPAIVHDDGEAEYEEGRILNFKIRYRKLYYHVQ